ncbi:hypothetical protein HPB49_004289 [Dermacentor silvarum]|uniref:Uncharacterized protein n=1 Tax=Dermacentor silvarum TaxID=543639 RepID=A0ACB8D2C9_DERSI|nr:hypothetical protein HPB49_004289 [Dermacentor silvarum]
MPRSTASEKLYDVDEKRVRYWIKQKDALAATNRSQKAFRGKKCKYPELEGELVKFVIDIRIDGYAVSTDMVRVKALNIARHMEIPQAEFKASRGWATRFLNRNQLSIRRISNSMNGTEDGRLWGDADADSSCFEGEDSDSDMES